MQGPLQFSFRDAGLHFPRLGLWMDPRGPVRNDETVFVSHAHSDHTGRHRSVLCTVATQRLMAARIGSRPAEQALPYGRTTALHGPGYEPYRITLLPAGHVLGSAMALVEAGGGSLLYTGDFKLRPGLSSEPCETARADDLIMETTFGRPDYVFPSTAEIVRGLTAFCAETVASGGTPAIAAYSLGKSQEVLAALGDSGLPVMLHAAAAKMTRVYEGLGRAFPSWKPLDAASCRGHVLIVPPGATAPLRRSLPRLRVASVSGWAVDTSHRHRAGADATFALSDHADFPGLLEFVRRVGPQRVFTLHGFAADFASHLRSLGLRAEALDDRGQMELPLGAALSPRARRRQDRATTCNAA